MNRLETPKRPYSLSVDSPRTIVEIESGRLDIPTAWSHQVDWEHVGASPDALVQASAGLSGDGLCVLESTDRLIAFSRPLSGQDLCWSEGAEGRLALSLSARSITSDPAGMLSDRYLALCLVESLPITTYAHLTPFRDVQAVPPLHYLEMRPGKAPNIQQGWRLPQVASDPEKCLQDLRSTLLAGLRRAISASSTSSADLSGGVDSTTNVYLMRGLNANPDLYHMRSDSESNGDEEFAKRVAVDIGEDLKVVPGLGATAKNFSLESYPGRSRPVMPLLWSDTEGYIDKITSSLNSEKHLHVVGIGGDELFGPLPSSVWTLFREVGWRSPLLALSYWRSDRHSFSLIMRDLFSRKSYGNELTTALRASLESGKPKRTLPSAWLGSVQLPPFLTPNAIEICAEYFEDNIRAIIPLDDDRSRHQALESLILQTRITREADLLFGERGVRFYSPFLEPDVVAAALSLPHGYRHAPRLNRAGLFHAVKGLVPREVFTRPLKGEYSSSLYVSFERARPTLLTQLADSLLGDLGLVDIDQVRTEMSMPTPSIDFLNSLERLVAVERWLRHAA